MVQPRLDDKYRQAHGYITLLSVLIISAIGLAVTISLILLGLGSGQSSLTLAKSAQAKALANACAEQALQAIRNSISFTGAGNLSLGVGSCNFTVTNTGGQTRLIVSTGQTDETIRKVKIIVSQINPQINISSWQELADF